MALELEVKRDETNERVVVSLKFSGRLYFEEGRELREETKKLLDKNIDVLLLLLNNLDKINNDGLVHLVRLVEDIKDANDRQTEIKIKNPSRKVSNFLAMRGIFSQYDIED